MAIIISKNQLRTVLRIFGKNNKKINNREISGLILRENFTVAMFYSRSLIFNKTLICRPVKSVCTGAVQLRNKQYRQSLKNSTKNLLTLARK